MYGNPGRTVREIGRTEVLNDLKRSNGQARLQVFSNARSVQSLLDIRMMRRVRFEGRVFDHSGEIIPYRLALLHSPYRSGRLLVSSICSCCHEAFVEQRFSMRHALLVCFHSTMVDMRLKMFHAVNDMLKCCVNGPPLAPLNGDPVVAADMLHWPALARAGNILLCRRINDFRAIPDSIILAWMRQALPKGESDSCSPTAAEEAKDSAWNLYSKVLGIIAHLGIEMLAWYASNAFAPPAPAPEHVHLTHSSDELL